ncbi:MAG: class I SAM-dependent methyltransferase [Acidobacteria bacterium]|nr:class I SAM-dependent methyltransferase [Acidobacteriota bacterium]
MHDVPMKNHYKRKACRACGGERLRPFITLGPTPLANSFLKSRSEFEREAFYPLDVYFCEECSLVQLADVVDPKILFGNYIYLTGTANTIVSHNQQYAETVVDFLQLNGDDLVIEVASNNGSLLRCFREQGIRTLGIEPAENIAAIANADGIETVNKFFNSATANKIVSEYGSARAVIGNNVLAHVDDTQDFLRGCKTLLRDDGLVIVEVPYLKEFVDLVEFDTIYHEHLCYFSVTSLMRLCDAVGLSIIRVDRVQVHGGSIRVYAEKKEKHSNHAAAVIAIAEDERKAGLTTQETFENFAEKTRNTREKLYSLLESLKAEGKSIAAYGAPAKGNTLLNYCGIDTRLLDFAVDKNPLKVGLFTPGAHLQVLPVSAVLERQPDYLLILAWNFASEIMQQQSEFEARGGRFIIPIPEPRIVEK